MKQGDLENLIMNAVWVANAQAPAESNGLVIDVQKIQDMINGANTGKKSWAYTTVKTVMDRLVDKGWLTRLKHGKKFLYQTILTQDNAAHEALHKVLRQYFNGNLARLRETLDAIERESGQSTKSTTLIAAPPSMKAGQAGLDASSAATSAGRAVISR